MKTLNDYISIRYEDGGRGPAQFDCWGLTLAIRHDMGFPALPSFGHIRHTMPIEFTRACNSVAKTMHVCEPETGAVAAVFRGKICTHVAVVVNILGRLKAVEINPKTGFKVMPVSEFERRYVKVVYYRD